MSLNSLTHLLDGVMPGNKALLRTTNGDRKKSKLCDFVEEFWHFNTIIKMSQQRFINTYCRWAKKKGYHPDERKAQEIYAVAQNGIPSRSGSSRRTSGGGTSTGKTGTALDRYGLGKYSLDKYDIMPKL